MDRLLSRVGHWEPQRWSAPVATAVGSAPDASRADLVYELCQQLADWGLSLEGQPRRTVPRLGNDQALADQVRVIAADLIAAGAPETILQEAMAAVNRALQAL